MVSTEPAAAQIVSVVSDGSVVGLKQARIGEIACVGSGRLHIRRAMNTLILAAIALVCVGAQAPSQHYSSGEAKHRARVSEEVSGEAVLRTATGTFMATSVGAQFLLAQATPRQRQVTPSNAPNSAPTVIPNGAPSATPNTSATCNAGCTSQFFSCSGPCQSTSLATTIIPSQTTAGITNNPGQCVQNCSTQMQICQRNCSFQ
jgi:hypothetical protein